MSSSDASINTSQMISAFNRAAPQYEAEARLQQEIANRLIERLQTLPLKPQRIVDLGCGTGKLTRQLQKQYPKADILALDIATNMLQTARQQAPRWFSHQYFCCADAHRLPLADNSVDLLVSNLMLQWCGDYKQVFAEFARVLKPEGRLLFSTFGPDTLKELRASWAQVDEHPHVNEFYDLHVLGDALLAAGLLHPVMDIDWLTMTFAEPASAMRHLQKIGAHNVLKQRQRGLMGKDKYRKVIEKYEQYRQEDGRIPATYEVTYGYAAGSQAVQKKQDGTTYIPVSHLQKP